MSVDKATWRTAKSWPYTLLRNGEAVATFSTEEIAAEVMTKLEAYEHGNPFVTVSVYEDGEGAVSRLVQVDDGRRHAAGRFAVRVDKA